MKHGLILLLLFAGFFFLHRGTNFEGPYSYDEADYMFAARMGFAANVTDTPTMPFPDFVRTGLNRGRDPGNRSGLSQAIRGSSDIVFYRHWHGPLYYYWLCAVDAFHLPEKSVRQAGLIWFCLAAAVLYFGALWTVPGPYAAPLSAAMFLWSRTALGSPELAPHALFAMCALLSLIALIKVLETAKSAYWYAAVVACAATFATIEMAFVLILTLVICCYWQRREWSVDWKFIGRSVLTFAVSASIFWPGALLKLSFVKAYFFMAYLALFRKSPWGNTTFWETWSARFAASPVEWALIAIGLILFFWRLRQPEMRRLYPVAIFSGLMILATLRVNTSEPRYGLMFGPELDLLAACAFSIVLLHASQVRNAAVVTALGAVLFIPGFLHSRTPSHPDLRGPALLAFVRENHLGGKSLWVPQSDVPMLHYYFPELHLRGYSGEAPDQAQPPAERVDGIVLPGFPIQFRLTN